MHFKKKTQEALFGTLFALPILAGVLLFSIWPILTTFGYSVSDYNPLSASKNRISVNLQEELDLLYGFLPETVGNLDQWSRDFPVAEFFDDELGLGLKPEQRASLVEHFDRLRFVQDFQAGRLNQIDDGVTVIKSYMGPWGEALFPAYAPTFTGERNYTKMFTQDQYFWLSLGNTFSYAIIVVIIQTMLAVFLALGANSRIPGVGAFKLIFFLPSITSSSAISMIFWMLYSKPGVINQVGASLGLTPVDWLNDPSTAIPAVIALNIWTTAGYFMLTFLAGLKGISAELYESAEIDGAPAWTVFHRITLPLLRPQILWVLIMGTIGCLQVFDQIYYLIPNLRNATMAFYIYKNAFFFGDMGYASALAVVLFAIILTITLLQRRFVKESEL